VTGLMLNGFHERWIVFIRTGKQHSWSFHRCWYSTEARSIKDGLR